MSTKEIITELKKTKPEIFRELLEYMNRDDYIRLQQEHRREKAKYFDMHIRYTPRSSWRDFERHNRKRQEIDKKYQILMENLPGTWETWFDLWEPPSPPPPPPPPPGSIIG